MIQNLKKTALYSIHKKNEAKFINFHGWEMPLYYSSIKEEHINVREKAGLFDIGHMGQVIIIGNEANQFLDYIITADIMKLKIKQSLYSFISNEEGLIIDDIIVTYLDYNKYILSINAINFQTKIDFLIKNSINYACSIKDMSMQCSLIALQGPKANIILEKITNKTWNHLKRFNTEIFNLLNNQILISRTGYTGEDGFEIYSSFEFGPIMANYFYEHSKEIGLVFVGLGARDSLRIEAGYPLYGNEISEKISPIEAGLGKFFNWNKKTLFIGKDKLKQKDLSKNNDNIVVFYCLEDRRIARKGDKVFFENLYIGYVLSGSYSPMNKKGIGSALIKKSYLNNEKLYINIRNNNVPMYLNLKNRS